MNEIEKAVLSQQLSELLLISKELSTKTESLNLNGFREELKTLSELTSRSVMSSSALSGQISKLKIPKNIEVTNRTIVKVDNVAVAAFLIVTTVLMLAFFFHWQLKQEFAQQKEIIDFAKNQKMPTAIELVRVKQVSLYDYIISQKEKQNLPKSK